MSVPIEIYDTIKDYPKQQLLEEYNLLKGNEKDYADSITPTGVPYWKVIRGDDMTSEFAAKVANYFKNTYKIEGKVDGRFYRLLANATLPYHTDRSTQCSVNMILSEGQAPVKFKVDGIETEYLYNIALLNTQVEHSVQNGEEDRIIFKISVFDESYDSVAAKIN